MLLDSAIQTTKWIAKETSTTVNLSKCQPVTTTLFVSFILLMLFVCMWGIVCIWWPLMIIWSVNQLFHLNIDYSIVNVVAAFVISNLHRL